MAIKVCVLGSGSKGNSVLVDNGRNRVLIDCGLTAPVLINKLDELGYTLDALDGILITHEHDDHVRSLGYAAKYAHIYAHEYTMEKLAFRFGIPLKNQMVFDTDEFTIGTMDVSTFRISHDVVHPLGFSITDGESRFTYATDSGSVTPEMMATAKGSDLIMIESNHDVDMLLHGRYPAFLKKRIVSEKGHLSNIACAEAVCELAENGTRRFILAHLSEQNNLPELAYWTNREELKKHGAEEGEIKLFVADQYAMSGWLV